MTHIVHKGLDFFVKPQKVSLNLNMKIGSLKVHPEDLKLLMRKVPVFMMSYYDNKAFMERELEISSADFPNGVVFFSYYEPVPAELNWDVDKRLISQLTKYFHLYDLIHSINSLIDETEGSSLQIGVYEEWLDRIMVKVPSENLEELRSMLSRFSLLYTTKILWKIFRGNFEELKKRTHEIAYKFYEVAGF